MLDDSPAPFIDALVFAAETHRGMFRRTRTSRPVIEHVLCVMKSLWDAAERDPELLTAALLHDIVEDTGMPIADLETRFGTNVAGLVAEVTDDKSVPRSRRRELQVEKAVDLSPGARLIRIADKIDNLRDIVGTTDPASKRTPKQQLAYTDWARDLWERIHGGNLRLDAAFERTWHDARASLGVRP